MQSTPNVRPGASTACKWGRRKRQCVGGTLVTLTLEFSRPAGVTAWGINWGGKEGWERGSSKLCDSGRGSWNTVQPCNNSLRQCMSCSVMQLESLMQATFRYTACDQGQQVRAR
jgi:hypothetical protein